MPDAGSCWSTPVVLNNGAHYAYLVRGTADGLGNAYAAWWEVDPTSNVNSVWVSRYSPGTGWVPQAIEADAGYLNVYKGFEMAANASGEAVLAWIEDPSNMNTSYGVHVVAYEPGSGWGTPALISGSEMLPAQDVKVGIDDSGRIVTTWAQETVSTGNQQLFIATGRADGGWTGPRQLNNPNDGPAVGATALSVNGAGDVLSTWLGGNNNLNSSFAAVPLADGGWGSVPLDLSSLYKANIVNAIGTSGGGVTLWQQYHGTGSLQDCAAESFASGTWTMTSVIDDTDAGYVAQIQVGAGGNDFGAVWVQGNAIVFSSYVGGVWGAPAVVAAVGGTPFIGANASGTGAIVWSDGYQMHAQTFDPGFGFTGAPESFTPAGTGSTDPIRVAVGPTGTKWVIYRANAPPMGYPSALASQCP